MNHQSPKKPRYAVVVSEPAEPSGVLYFSFSPLDHPPEHGAGYALKRPPQFVVAVRQEPAGLAFDWSGTPDDPGPARDEMQFEITARLKDRTVWIERVKSLVGTVEQWARELGWATRRIDKKLEDPQIGDHRVQALLMQQDTCRMLLEPVGRSTLGAEGIVDLYLMPAYDDIARLYYYGDQWNLHYSFSDARLAAKVREAEDVPLSKGTFEAVLTNMKQLAA